jgi:hypothetical protein
LDLPLSSGLELTLPVYHGAGRVCTAAGVALGGGRSAILLLIVGQFHMKSSLWRVSIRTPDSFYEKLTLQSHHRRR